MATSSFDRTFIIDNEESLKHLIKAIENATDARPPLFTTEERERGERLLRECVSRQNSQ